MMMDMNNINTCLKCNFFIKKFYFLLGDLIKIIYIHNYFFIKMNLKNK